MKCPHCSEPVSLFSKEMNKAGKLKTCPKCGKSMQVSLNPKLLAILSIPAIVVIALLLLNGGLLAYAAVGVVAVAWLVPCMRLTAPNAKAPG